MKKDKPAPENQDKSPKKNIEDVEKILDELSKPSKGDELIKKLQEEEKEEKKEEEKNKEDNNDYASYVTKDNVEVIDVKVIPKDKEQNKNKLGIPSKKRNDWDKIK